MQDEQHKASGEVWPSDEVWRRELEDYGLEPISKSDLWALLDPSVERRCYKTRVFLQFVMAPGTKEIDLHIKGGTDLHFYARGPYGKSAYYRNSAFALVTHRESLVAMFAEYPTAASDASRKRLSRAVAGLLQSLQS